MPRVMLREIGRDKLIRVYSSLWIRLIPMLMLGLEAPDRTKSTRPTTAITNPAGPVSAPSGYSTESSVSTFHLIESVPPPKLPAANMVYSPGARLSFVVPLAEIRVCG